MRIPFNQPYLTGDEQACMLQALQSRRHCGNYEWGMKCVELMKAQCGFLEVHRNGAHIIEGGRIKRSLVHTANDEANLDR